jgi:CRISPR/Cas system CSM-associated protein Csm3 (group 7 of RAMP superfamily)
MKMTDFDFSTFENRYLISATLQLEKPMHVGRGTSLEPVGTDLPVAIDQHKNPFIPGSSVKGVLRSEIERILRTLEAQQKKIEGEEIWACDATNPCLEKEERRNLIDKYTINL